MIGQKAHRSTNIPRPADHQDRGNLPEKHAL
jgi:hypothetical protein